MAGIAATRAAAIRWAVDSSANAYERSESACARSTRSRTVLASEIVVQRPRRPGCLPSSGDGGEQAPYPRRRGEPGQVCSTATPGSRAGRRVRVIPATAGPRTGSGPWPRWPTTGRDRSVRELPGREALPDRILEFTSTSRSPATAMPAAAPGRARKQRTTAARARRGIIELTRLRSAWPGNGGRADHGGHRGHPRATPSSRALDRFRMLLA